MADTGRRTRGGGDVDEVVNRGFEAWLAVIGGRHSDIPLGIMITESR